MKRILFFDDESFVTKMLISNLQINYGWNQNNLGEITFVSTPKELFDKVNEKVKYDLYVLDIMVPIELINKTDLFSKGEIDKMQKGDNTGVVIAEKIKEITGDKKVPVLFLSARMQPSKMEENTDYIEKPAYALDISEKMKKLLNI